MQAKTLNKNSLGNLKDEYFNIIFDGFRLIQGFVFSSMILDLQSITYTIAKKEISIFGSTYFGEINEGQIKKRTSAHLLDVNPDFVQILFEENENKSDFIVAIPIKTN